MSMRTFVAGSLVMLTVVAGAQERDRSKIPDTLKWNLSDLYPSDAAWRTAKDKIAADISSLRQFRGKLTSSAGTLADGLDRLFALDKELSRLAVYASLEADQDTRDSQHQGMRQAMTQIGATFGAEAAYFEPEILKAGKGAVEALIASEPRLTWSENPAIRRPSLVFRLTSLPCFLARVNVQN